MPPRRPEGPLNREPQDQQPESEKKSKEKVAVVVRSLDGKQVLIKRTKKSQGMKKAIISGAGPFAEHPGNPRKVAQIEVKHSIGVEVPEEEIHFEFLNGRKRVHVFSVFVDKDKAISSGGTSIGLEWVDNEEGADSQLRHGHEKYIARVTGVQKRKDQ